MADANPKLQADSDAILQKDTLTEKDILKLARRVRNDGVKLNYNEEYSYLLTPEQNAKGIAWLRNQWKTPRGIERKNNPFGEREQHVLENFDYFTFNGFHQPGAYAHQITPLYTCYGKGEDGGSFQYYLWGGEISIIG